ncbi:MAG: DNA polymerase III subunit delta [Proteobacteria bacterium]|nr:DNA polymerase III subunit delta [Pseudomonadota bacterium]
MNLDELAAELRAGTVRPAYLLAGDELLLRDDALALLRETVVAPGTADFNTDRLAGDKTSSAALKDSVRALPVMASRRLVVLEEPDRERSREGLRAALPEVVQELVAQEQTVLVVTAAQPDRRTKWVKAFAAPAVSIDCSAPRNARQIAAFARSEAERQGAQLEPGAAELLAERVGPKLLVLRQEIAKASLLAGPGVRIERHHVEEASCDVAEAPIWDLTDAIGEGRAGDALATLGRLLAGGAAPPLLLGSLAAHFRKLARLRGGGKVPGPPFVQRKLSGQARRYTAPRLVRCLKAIHQADLALKGQSALKPSLTLERLVLGLAA